MLIPAFGIGSLFGIVPDEGSIKVFASLGYPAYIIPFLSIAKILGLIAILIPKFPRLKEWAYAGIVYDVIGAIYSQIALGNPFTHMLFPLLALAFVMGSYFLYHKKLQMLSASQN